MAGEFLTYNPNLNQMSCALVHASALPVIGVLPGCLAALVSLVRLVVASVFCLVSMIALAVLMGFVPQQSHNDFFGLRSFQVEARIEASLSAFFLVRSLLSIISVGFYGFCFEQISKQNYATIFGRDLTLYEGYNQEPIWFS